jgi:hypothetical protein
MIYIIFWGASAPVVGDSPHARLRFLRHWRSYHWAQDGDNARLPTTALPVMLVVRNIACFFTIAVLHRWPKPGGPQRPRRSEMMPIPAEGIAPLLGLLLFRFAAPVLLILLLGRWAQRADRWLI